MGFIRWLKLRSSICSGHWPGPFQKWNFFFLVKLYISGLWIMLGPTVTLTGKTVCHIIHVDKRLSSIWWKVTPEHRVGSTMSRCACGVRFAARHVESFITCRKHPVLFGISYKVCAPEMISHWMKRNTIQQKYLAKPKFHTESWKVLNQV